MSALLLQRPTSSLFLTQSSPECRKIPHSGKKITRQSRIADFTPVLMSENHREQFTAYAWLRTPYATLCENVKSSTKLEVDSILYFSSEDSSLTTDNTSQCGIFASFVFFVFLQADYYCYYYYYEPNKKNTKSATPDFGSFCSILAVGSHVCPTFRLRSIVALPPGAPAVSHAPFCPFSLRRRLQPVCARRQLAVRVMSAARPSPIHVSHAPWSMRQSSYYIYRFSIISASLLYICVCITITITVSVCQMMVVMSLNSRD